MKISNEALEETILRLASDRNGDSICPSEVARDIASKAGLDWKTLLLEVRAAAVRMAKTQRVVILRAGEPVDPDRFRGLYRIAAADGFPAVLPVATSSFADRLVPPRPPAYAEPAPQLEPELEPEIELDIELEPDPGAAADMPAQGDEEPAFVREIVERIAQAPLSVPVPDDIEPRVVLTVEDLLHGDFADEDLEDLPPLVFDEPDETYRDAGGAYAHAGTPVETADEDDDPDLYRAPDAATLDDVAAGLQRYLAPELDDAARWDAEIGNDVVGLPGEENEQPVLPSWHDAFGRYLEGSPADEERG